jgi:hypothetical protein
MSEGQQSKTPNGPLGLDDQRDSYDVQTPFLIEDTEASYRSRNNKISRVHLKRLSIRIAFSFAGFLFLLVFGLAILGLQQNIMSCGNSPMEAIARNCRFDVMNYAWVAKECYDEELQKEFEPFKDWAWYKDPEGAVQLSEDEIKSGRLQDVYPALTFQLQQCAYGWKRLQRALADRKPVDNITASVEHSSRCAKLVLDQPNTFSRPTGEIISHASVQYSTCLRL